MKTSLITPPLYSPVLSWVVVAVLLDAVGLEALVVVELAALEDVDVALELFALGVDELLLETALLLVEAEEVLSALLCVSLLDELLSSEDTLELSSLELLLFSFLLLSSELSFFEEELVESDFRFSDSICALVDPPSVVPVTLFTTTFVALKAIKILTMANGVIKGGVR